MVTIASFQNAENAHLFRAFLNGRGLEATVLDENTVQAAWYYSGAIGGVRVVAADDDREEAREGLREFESSLDLETRPVTVARAGLVGILLSLVLGVPSLLFGNKKVFPAKHGSKETRD